MKGKKKCKILKEIRKEIAKQNDIAYVTSECKHQGDCRGTCPKCEAEVRYLEEELRKRSLAGKKVAVAGVAAAMVVSASGCGLEDLLNIGQTAGDMMPESRTEVGVNGDIILPESSDPTEEFTATDGELVPEDSSEIETMGEEPISDEPLAGLPMPDDSSDEEFWEGEIPGDIILPEESSEDEVMGEEPVSEDDSEDEFADDSEVELGGDPMPDDYVGE
ncbi:MAG: hypothetical protein IJB88_08375 [Clostridia bacterium]|nr:hypothetical protein [Clostridia bacterium]